MAEKKQRKGVKRKDVQATVSEVEKQAPTETVTETVTEKVHLTKLTVEVDDAEFRLIETYAKIWNDSHADLECFQPIGPAEFLLFATLKWCEYEEKGAEEGLVGDELGAEDDAPPDQLCKTVGIVPDPIDDDPEFVDALVGRVRGAP